MAGGNFNPAPLKFGASNNTNLESILNSLRESMGTGFDVAYGSTTWIYLNAIARIFNDVFEQNKRLSNQWDPERMTDFLSRWETILGLNVIAGDTLIDRRIKVETKLRLVGTSPNQQVITDLLRNILGNDVFVSILVNNSNSTNVHIPGGVVIPGGATIPDGAWYSDVSYIPIKVQQPDYMDDLTFYQTVGQIFFYLEGLMPAWTTYDWFRISNSSETGFILDDEWNLDNEAFDS